MAQQLLQEGEEVALLALIDTERQTALRAFGAELRFAWRRGKHMLAVISEIVRADHRSRTRIVSDLLRRKVRAIRPDDCPEIRPEMSYRFKMSYRRLLSTYAAGQYPGRITLIVNEERYRFDRNMGWKGIPKGGLAIHKASGDHWTMVTQLEKELAQLLLSCIDQALPESGRQADRTGVGIS